MTDEQAGKVSTEALVNGKGERWRVVHFPPKSFSYANTETWEVQDDAGYFIAALFGPDAKATAERIANLPDLESRLTTAKAALLRAHRDVHSTENHPDAFADCTWTACRNNRAALVALEGEASR